MMEQGRKATTVGVGRILRTAEAGTLPKVRIFVEPDKLDHDRAILAGSAYHHIKNVLRMNPGDTLVIFDRAGREVLAALEVFQAETAVARVLAPTAASTESSLDLTLAPAVQWAKTQDDEDLVTQDKPYGSGNFGQVGGWARLRLDTRQAMNRTSGSKSALPSLFGTAGYPVSGVYVEAIGTILSSGFRSKFPFLTSALLNFIASVLL